jgi:hypothetical protein
MNVLVALNNYLADKAAYMAIRLGQQLQIHPYFSISRTRGKFGYLLVNRYEPLNTDLTYFWDLQDSQIIQRSI